MRSCSESISPSRTFTRSWLRANGDDGLFEPFAQVLIRLPRLFQLFVFAPQCAAQGYFLASQLFEFFILRHAATLADLPVIPQLHSPSE